MAEVMSVPSPVPKFRDHSMKENGAPFDSPYKTPGQKVSVAEDCVCSPATWLVVASSCLEICAPARGDRVGS